MWTSELHGAVAHASQDQIIGKRECAAGQAGGGHRFQIRDYDLQLGRTKTVVVSACLLAIYRSPQRSKSKIHFILRWDSARTIAQAPVGLLVMNVEAKLIMC
jgi:hypothetical protein